MNSPTLNSLFPSLRVILPVWFGLLVITGIALFGLARMAPFVLRHDRDTSTWYHQFKAEEYWNRWLQTGNLDPASAHDLLDNTFNHIRLVVEALPERTSARFLQAQAEYQLGILQNPPDSHQINQALAQVEDLFLESGRNWKNPALFLAQHYFKSGNQIEAIKWYQEVLHIDPKDEAPYDTIIELYLNMKEPREVLAILDRKAEQLPVGSDDLERRTLAYIQMEDYTSADNLLSEVLMRTGPIFRIRAVHCLTALALGQLSVAFTRLTEIRNTLLEQGVWPNVDELEIPHVPAGISHSIAYLILESGQQAAENP